VATESARAVALACGLPDERVRVIGLPIRRAFAEMSSHPKPEVRAQLGLSPDRPAVMLTGGGAGIGRLLPNAQAIARRLAAQGVSAQLIIITGHNRELQRRLRAESWPVPVTIRGYVDNMAEWLAAADILISKAGPGTLAEAASLGVPVIIADFVPGQEEGNVAWTLQHGAGVFERNPDQIAALVADWLLPGNPTLRRMSAQARAIARPHAASEIVTAALRLLEQRPCP
jgi:1,2-diacylglycerol 3-beta-galactosyltransferase